MSSPFVCVKQEEYNETMTPPPNIKRVNVTEASATPAIVSQSHTFNPVKLEAPTEMMPPPPSNKRIRLSEAAAAPGIVSLTQGGETQGCSSASSSGIGFKVNPYDEEMQGCSSASSSGSGADVKTHVILIIDSSRSMNMPVNDDERTAGVARSERRRFCQVFTISLTTSCAKGAQWHGQTQSYRWRPSGTPQLGILRGRP